tara:strand:- start:3101 stop:4117 length:1017 start_codon:yes stop_codon:yes gene_type:complete
MKKNLKNKKIVITGSDGFIGSHLVESLVSKGCDVTALVMYNSLNSWGWLDKIDVKTMRKVKVVSGDIRDRRCVNKLCKDADYIFHLASLIAIPHSYDSPYSYLDTNILGTLNILEYCRENKIERLIHTSTSEVYGEYNKIPISELTPQIAKSPYSATKIAADQLAYSYYKTYNIPLSIIRPFNTYGPRQSNRAIIPTIITQIIDNQKAINLGSLYPTRDFTFVSDTVEGFIKIAEETKTIGETINIGSGYEISIKKLVSTIKKIMKSSINVKEDKNRIRPKEGEVNRLKADNRKAYKIANWKPYYRGISGLEKGLKETIKWFSDSENMKIYKSSIFNK